MPLDIYALLRNNRTADAALGSFYTDTNTNEVSIQQTADMMLSDNNVAYLTEAIVSQADQSQLVGDTRIISDTIHKFLTSWKNLGKFDNPTPTVSPVMRLDELNNEFIKAFAQKIIPTASAMDVKSVVDPSGMYAQQEQSLLIVSTPIPFYERAIYRRLGEMHTELAMDESESLFYRMDSNPNLIDAERKKTEPTKPVETSLEHLGLSFNMLPKY
jgi:hypothetical protein